MAAVGRRTARILHGRIQPNRRALQLWVQCAVMGHTIQMAATGAGVSTTVGVGLALGRPWVGLGAIKQTQRQPDANPNAPENDRSASTVEISASFRSSSATASSALASSRCSAACATWHQHTAFEREVRSVRSAAGTAARICWGEKHIISSGSSSHPQQQPPHQRQLQQTQRRLATHRRQRLVDPGRCRQPLLPKL